MRPQGWSWCAVVLAVAAAGCGDDKPPGQPEIASQPVGPSGGVVSVEGIDLVIPPGALTGTETITVTRTGDSAPAGYSALSPVFRLEPSGLVFVKPVEIEIAFDGPTEGVTVFWSKLGAPGYDDVGGTLGLHSITASNTHFSEAFAGEDPAAFVVMPAMFDFGSVTVGASSSLAELTFTNTGGSTSAPATVSATAPYQIVSTTCTGVLAAGASCLARVQFTPTAVGAAPGTVVLSAGTTSATADLVGVGVGFDPLSVNPSFHDFGAVDLSATSAPFLFTVSNTGGVATGALTLALTGSNPGDFTISTNACSAALAPGATCTFALQARPTQTGARSATLVLTANPGGSLLVPLTVQGRLPAALDLTPAAHDFGSVAVGTSSATRTFTITNPGGASTGTPAVSITGPNATAFQVVTSTCTAPLAAGASCTVAVRYQPLSLTTATASLEIVATPGGTASAGLTGFGTEGGFITATPTVVDFGSWLVGAPATAQTITITNQGSTPTGVPSATIGGAGAADFSIAASTCTAPLAAAQSCSITVGFAASTGGMRTGTLQVSAQPGSTVAVALAGAGLAPATLSSSVAALSFGSVAVGATGAPSTVTFTNTGDAPTGSVVLTIAGPDAARFSLSANTCTGQLAAGASCSAGVVFAPLASGPRTATLTASATPGGAATIALDGTGSSAMLQITPAAQDLGSVVVGQTGSPVGFTVTNTGAAVAPALATALAGPNPGDFLPAADTCAGTLLAPGASCVVTVRFSPLTSGTRSSVLRLTSGSDVLDAALTGTGVAQAQLVATPATFDAGAVAIGAGSPLATITITNAGGTTTGALATNVTGPSAAGFALAADTCSGAALAPGATCTVAVRFAPTATGAHSASLAIAGTPGGSAQVALSGTGVTPSAIAIVESVFDFGIVVAGQASAPHTFAVVNNGGVATGTLTISLVSDPAFELVSDGCTGVVLAPAAHCQVTARFVPVSGGAKTAELFALATPGGTVRANLAGTALTPAALALTPSTTDFGAIPVGGTSAPQIFTLTNTGQQTAGVPAFLLTGADAGQFVFAMNTCVAPLAAGATCTFQVRFSPTTTGVKSATASISSSPGGAVSAALSGTSITPATLALTPSLTDFGTVALGSSAVQTYTLTNIGQQTAGVPSLTRSGPDASEFLFVLNACTAPLASGASCTFQVQFVPMTTGPKSATVSATSTPGGTATASVAGTAI